MLKEGLKFASWENIFMGRSRLVGSGFQIFLMLYLNLASFNPRVTTDGSSFITLLVYVHDIVLAGTDVEALSSFTKLLNMQFKLKDLGDLKFFLGLEIARNSTGISIC